MFIAFRKSDAFSPVSVQIPSSKNTQLLVHNLQEHVHCKLNVYMDFDGDINVFMYALSYIRL